MSCDYIFKFITVGETFVGKSSITLQFTNKKFNPVHNTTIGVEFGSRIINVENRKIKVQIWDTAGQERFRSITRSYYKGAAAVLLIYDITREESFLSLKKWLSDINDMTKNPYIVLVGNKSDLNHLRAITEEQGRDFASEHNMKFFETSAIKGTNIDEIFISTCKDILHSMDLGLINAATMDGGIKKIKNDNVNTVNDSEYYKTIKKQNRCCND
jgi:Ras-related protein Rab-2A